MSGGSVERWAHWPRQTESPYYRLFYEAMAAHRVTAVATLELTEEWLASNSADAIHVHWPDGLWRQQGKSILARWRGIAQMRRFLSDAKRRGLEIIWTVHNTSAHEGGDWIDQRAYATLARLTDLFICHSRSSADEIRRVYSPSGHVLVAHHGTFEDVYPRPRSRELVLQELGLDPVQPVVSCLGLMRAYKGLELACEAVQRLNGQVQLVIAGPLFRKYDLRPITKAVDGLSSAKLLSRRLTDQEFADLTSASDVALLPYQKVTTSGALLASWTLGTGVIASDLPYFREMIPSTSLAGRLFRPGDPSALAESIAAYLRIPRETRSAAAFAEAQKYSWRACIAPVVEWIGRRRHEASRRLYGQLQP